MGLELQKSKIKYPPAAEQLPVEIAKSIYEDVLKNGSTAIDYFDFISEFLKQDAAFDNNDISLCFRCAIYTINYLSTEDPSQLHYHAAREALREIGQDALAADEKARDLLARELVKECNALAAQIIPNELLQENIRDKEEGLFLVRKTNKRAQYLVYPLGEKLWLDEIFIQHISKIGPKGKEDAAGFAQASSGWYQEYQNTGKALDLFRLWVDLTREPYYCRYVKMLAFILWEDRCSRQWEREGKNVPALTHGVHPSVAKILSNRIETQEIESGLQMLHNGKIVATLPTIDPKLIPTVTKGVGSLNSLYHHKLIRFECRVGFENWASGKADVRLLKFERGYSEISEKLGFHNRSAADEVKNILHAQAHMHFYFDDGSSGNLIVLSKFRSSHSGREEGIMITLGPQLIPHYTFQTTKKARLLIPVPELPPLISSTNSHAAQAALQMLVMQEFANHSVELAEIGSIEIPTTMWTKLATDAGLSSSVFKQTLDRWLHDGDDGPRFLIKRGEHRYSFGEAYNKEEAFLVEQGVLRKKRQLEGKKSVAKRRKI